MTKNYKGYTITRVNYSSKLSNGRKHDYYISHPDYDKMHPVIAYCGGGSSVSSIRSAKEAINNKNY